jgi:transcriptional regulator with XRE-family HTH domain
MMESESDRRSPPEREDDILGRLKEAREFLRLSQKEFAEQIGISRERLASYESGRARLRCDVALRMCRHFFISELWLATGQLSPAGERRFGRLGDDLDARLSMSLFTRPIFQRLNAGKLFSEAFDTALATEYKALWSEHHGWPPIVFSPGDDPRILISAMAVYVELCTNALPIVYLARFYGNIIKATVVLTDQIGIEDSRHGQDGTEFTVALEDFLAKSYPDASRGVERLRISIPTRAGIIASKKTLTETSANRKIPPVKSPMKILLAKVSALTKERGRKVALANFLHVNQSRVSEWLSDKVEPSGEVTLRLLEWVNAEEVKQQIALGGADNTAKGLTRSTHHSHEKRQTGPRQS